MKRNTRKNLETLKSIDKSELFTITGRFYYENNTDLAPGIPLKLVREPENEFDMDAIAVYAGDVKIGYVANNNHTKHELTSAASELKDKIQNTTQAKYLLYLKRYSDIEFHIGRIIKTI